MNPHWHVTTPRTHVYIRVPPWCCPSCGSGQLPRQGPTVTTGSHREVSLPEVLCAAPSQLSPPNPWSFHCLQSCLFQDVIVSQTWNHTVWPFQTDFLHLLICIQASNMFFNGLMAHFFFSFLFFCWIIFHCLFYLFTLKDILVGSEFWQLGRKLL